MLNQQTPSDPAVETAGLLVHSIFRTIQGEGPFAGQPALFLRLAGCNLQCPLCDTEYTQGAEPISYERLRMRLRYAKNREDDLLVITGGEPFRQSIGPLIESALELGWRVQVETNGTLWRPIPLHRRLYIVCSPKAGGVNKKLWPHIDALKYVVHADSIDPDDGLPILALDHPNAGRVARPHPELWRGRPSDIYIQPVDTKDPVDNQRHAAAAVQSAMAHGYTVCLQMHKILGME